MEVYAGSLEYDLVRYLQEHPEKLVMNTMQQYTASDYVA